MELALENAGVKPHEVDLISAHGTGTKANDVTEARAIRQVFGEDTPRTVSHQVDARATPWAPPVRWRPSPARSPSCTGFIPPTINHTATDPECAVDCVPNAAVEADLRIVQNNGLAFGGNNAIVILGKYEGEQ